MSASSSRSSPYDLQRHQNFERLLDLLRKGRDNGHLYRYRTDIQRLLRNLGRYSPKSFDELMTDPVRLEKTISSLENLVSQWSDYNPTLIETINDFDKFKIYNALLTALELDDQDDISKWVAELGFSSEIAQRLISDPTFRAQTVTAMKVKLDQWASTPTGQITKLDPVHLYFLPESVKERMIESLFLGVLDLQTAALLATPQGVEVAQYTFGLPVSGVKQDFLRDYSGKYYTRRCTDFNSPGECLSRAAEAGDVVIIDHAEINNDNADYFFRALGRGGHTELVEKYARQIFSAQNPDKPEANQIFDLVNSDTPHANQVFALMNSDLPVKAALSTYRFYVYALLGALETHHLEIAEEYLKKLDTMLEIIGDVRNPYMNLRIAINSRILEYTKRNDLSLIKMLKSKAEWNKYLPSALDLSLKAGQYGNLEMIKWLENNNLLNPLNALAAAVVYCNVEVFDYLIVNANENLDAPLDQYLIKAIKNGCLPIVQTLIEMGVILGSGREIDEAFQSAAEKGKIEVVALVYEKFGKALNLTDTAILNIIMIELKSGDYDTAIFLFNMIGRSLALRNELTRTIFARLFMKRSGFTLEQGEEIMHELFKRGLTISFDKKSNLVRKQDDLLQDYIFKGNLIAVGTLIDYILEYKTDFDFDEDNIRRLFKYTSDRHMKAELERLY